jgi:Cupredoxin-like domain
MIQLHRVVLSLLGLAARTYRKGTMSHHKRARMSLSRTLSTASMLIMFTLASLAAVNAARADNPIEIALSYKDKKFDPPEINAPSNTPIVIKFRNLDREAMELESDALHIEKVVAAGKDATIKIRAQKPGRYEFFDEYNEKTARGALVVK